MKSRQFFSYFSTLVFSVTCDRLKVHLLKTQQEREKIMEIVSSGSSKKRYKCFRKLSHIEICKKRFKELESLGFDFGEFGFAGYHLHFQDYQFLKGLIKRVGF